MTDDVDEGQHHIETDRMHRSIGNKKTINELLNISIKFEDREPHEILNGLEIIIPSKVVAQEKVKQKVLVL